MSTVELYTKDTRVWIPDADKVWKAAKLLENYDSKVSHLKILIENDEIEIEYDINSNKTPNSSLPPLRNPEILIGQNDLTALSYLNEPEVLYNLEVRFINNNQIYTYCGIVLVAINPYEQLPIYGNEIIQAYNGCDVQNMDPHIFAVSEEAFQKMVHFNQNQSIIVSGESGAGKTVSAKYTMRYFANVGGSSEETQVEKKVLASNPIMEAFGNAKTTRNDNSSRFGKFIQIDFNRQHHIVGASMRTYLLEKSRVVFQSANERNYHIFYQLCSQSKIKEYEYLHLASSKDFLYTNQGVADEIDNVDDNLVFKDTLEAFRLLDITKEEQLYIFSLLSAILHLGNVQIVNERTNESCSINENDESIKIMCDLLTIEEEKMRTWLCYKRIKTVNEVVNTPLPLSQALFSRDALAKHMYSQLFNWIVSKINTSLKNPTKTHSFIGVLDIYGFETFLLNSFEQFCINYANEKLQQQFCQHVFKLEQEEYMIEQIEWSFIEFYDNQPCIELIEGKIGILDLLDEECKMPKGSDLTWCNKLYDKNLKTVNNTQQQNQINHFSKPRMSNKSFIIHHFAEKVEYQCDGFLEKNRDTVLEEQLKVLKSSEYDFIANLFTEEIDELKPNGYEIAKRNTMPAPSKTQAIRKKTVGSQFRESLNSLMQALNSTTPHYVRCIKPNDHKAPFNFDAKRAVEQLRACGVLETVRISAAGYPSRWTYQEFFQRYKMLVNSRLIRNRKALKETCESILITLIQDQSKYQFGKTKIFFQAGQVAYLEKLRSEKLKACGIIIQKHVRGWLSLLKYRKMKRSALLIQHMARGKLARHLLKQKRCERAAIKIQTAWRAYLARKLYANIRENCIRVQALCRGYLARKNRQKILLNIKATKVQACVRGWLARKRYKKIMRGILQLQSHFRRRKARSIYKKLKIEARSVEHQKQLNKGLENKIISMQQQIEKINKEREILLVKCAELEPLKAQIITLKQQTQLFKDLNLKVNELNDALLNLKQINEKLKADNYELNKAKEQVEQSLKAIESKSNAEIIILRKELDETRMNLTTNQSILDEFKNQLIELENERANHQKLINEYGLLEQRYENLLISNTKKSKHQQKEYLNEEHEEVGEIEEKKDKEVQQSETIAVSLSSSSSLKRAAVNMHYDHQLKADVENFEENKLLYMTANGSEMDVTLIHKLQRRIAQLELEKKSRQNKQNEFYLDKCLNTNNENYINKNELSFNDYNINVNNNNPMKLFLDRLQNDLDYELIKSQELEFENQKLREDLCRLRDLITENSQIQHENLHTESIHKEMYLQFDALNEEVQRRRDECIQLKSLLVINYRNQHQHKNIIQKINNIDLSSINQQQNERDTLLVDLSLINTDANNEYEIGFNTQKILNRLLENQLNEMQLKHEIEKDELIKEIQILRDENNRQQDLLLAKNLTPENLAEATYKNEIIKLADQNLELSEKCDKYYDEIKKYKKMLKIYIKRNRTLNLNDRMNSILISPSLTSLSNIGASTGVCNITASAKAIQPLNSTLSTQYNLGAVDSSSFYQKDVNLNQNQILYPLNHNESQILFSNNSFNLPNNSTTTLTADNTNVNNQFNILQPLSSSFSHTESSANTNSKIVTAIKQQYYVPQIRIVKNDHQCMGYLEWKKEDESQIIQKLIDDLKPRLALTFLPGLPAYILFMCIRYADLINDEERVRSLLNLTVQTIKRLIKKKQEDLEYVVLWIANTCRLLHTLKQYSGEVAFQIQNTAKQNEHCLKNFDLTEYRGILSDIAIWLYQGIIKDFEKKIGTLIVKAMLEHVSLTGITQQNMNKNASGIRISNNNNNNNSFQNTFSSLSDTNSSTSTISIDSLIKKLSEFLHILNSHAVDPQIVNQIFKQLFYFIAATTFNNLILRKEMCNWSKGIELRFNISQLEQFIRDSKLNESGACETLEPIIQTCQLLQSRKTEADIKSICEMCSQLTIAQIQRILFLYTPLDSYEEKLTRQFIDKCTNYLKEVRKTHSNTEQQVLIIDTKKQFSVCVPFNPSNIGLESIELPEQLDLGFLKKI